MADISQYLQAIMAAVYGEDVRGSIHDAIEIINDVSEAVLTTGTAVTGPTSSSTGFFEDSLYLNTNTFELWKCTGTNSWASQGVLKGDAGEAGNGIASITLQSTAGLVDTYQILYDDGTSTTFDVTNGEDGQNGNKWYRGTDISGKDVNPTVFVNSGITAANPNDFYLNPTEGAIYHCVTGGAASVATWSYDFTMTGGGGGGGTSDYNDLTNKPVVNSVTLAGSKSLSDLGIQAELTGLTASVSELNILDGVTADASEINILDGVTASTAEINTLDGLTASTAELNILDGVTASALDINKLDGLTATKAELDYVHGVTSAIQTQLDSKAASSAIPTINAGTFTVTQNGSTKGTFTNNQATATSADIQTDYFWPTTTTVSSGTFSFSGLDDTKGYGFKPWVQVIGTSTNKNPTASIASITGAGSSNMTISYTTDADNGATVKLRVYK